MLSIFKNLHGAIYRFKDCIKSLIHLMLTLIIMKRLNWDYFIGKLLVLKIFPSKLITMEAPICPPLCQKTNKV